jgi:acyl carrier protein
VPARRIAVSDAVFAAVARCVSAALEVSSDRVTEKARLVDDFGATSLEMVDVVMTLSDQFGIEIPGEDSMAAETVGDLVELVRRHS